MNFRDFENLSPEFQGEVMKSLPDSANNFIRLIGLEKTLALISCFGGIEARFVSNEYNFRFQKFSSVIGIEATRLLAKEYPEQEVYIPFCKSARAMLRNWKMVADYDDLCKSGRSTRDIISDLVIKYQMNHRAIERIVNSK